MFMVEPVHVCALLPCQSFLMQSNTQSPLGLLLCVPGMTNSTERLSQRTSVLSTVIQIPLVTQQSVQSVRHLLPIVCSVWQGSSLQEPCQSCESQVASWLHMLKFPSFLFVYLESLV